MRPCSPSQSSPKRQCSRAFREQAKPSSVHTTKDEAAQPPKTVYHLDVAFDFSSKCTYAGRLLLCYSTLLYNLTLSAAIAAPALDLHQNADDTLGAEALEDDSHALAAAAELVRRLARRDALDGALDATRAEP